MNMRIYMDCLWNGGCELLIGTIASTYLPYIQIHPFGITIKRTPIYELMKDIQFKQGFKSYVRRTESLDLLFFCIFVKNSKK
jgi:hypothetical protein